MFEKGESKMPATAIFCGIVLIFIGLAGYLYGVSIGAGSPTALIPSAIGVILAILGLVAQRNEGMRKHLMHGALVVAFLGLAATAGRLISKGSVGTTAADLSTLATALICLLFIVLGIRSFMSARADRL